MSEIGKPAAAFHPSPCRVLLAEDDPANALVSSALLEMFGYDHHHVTDGVELVKRAKTGFYSVFMVDIRLPLLNGIEATRQIREYERKTGHRPSQILCVTAEVLTGMQDVCLEAGMDDYLPKPFDLDVFQAKLAALAEKITFGRSI